MKRSSTFFIGLVRVLLALTFIFSGFVKSMDPWGTAIKLGEYFSAFGMEWLSEGRYAFSIVLSAAEMILGLCLLFRIKERSVSVLTLLFTAFFTLLTLVLAIWNPVSDCGCFGDAVKLTNWQTFYKNIVLLLFAVLLWRSVRKKYHKPQKPVMVEWSMVFMFSLFSVGVGLYSMRHLPLIDFLPFKTGVNIPSQMSGKDRGQVFTTVIYRDRTSGKEQEFALTDTTWYDTIRWEFVDTRVIEQVPESKPTIQEFSVFNDREDITQSLLHNPQATFMVTLTDPDRISRECRTRLAGLAAYAGKKQTPILCVTPAPLPENDTLVLDSGTKIPCYNIDATTLKTLIRSHEGVVLLQDGTILAKWSCRDIPQFTGQADRSPLSIVLQRAETTNRTWLLGILITALVLIYISYFMHRGER